MPAILIDGKHYEVGEGRNVLQAALDNKLDLPYFCWHPAMGSVGACRLCAVKLYRDEADKHGRLVMGCMTPATEGTRVAIEEPEAVQFRRSVVEWLMINHPHDCPVCDEGGECHLQDMTVMTGHAHRRYRGRKRTYRNQYLGPLIHHEMNRCIQCYRCVRFYCDHTGGDDLGVFASRDRVYFGRVEDGVLQSPFAGNLVEVCPTGVFTDETLRRHYTRKWDLQQAPSVCTHCGLGCNTLMGSRYGSVRRVKSRFNSEVNGYWLCDRGRFGYEHLNAQDRLLVPRSRRAPEVDSPGRDVEALHADAREAVAKAARAGTLAAVGSPRAGLETNFTLRTMVGEERFCPGIAEPERRLVQRFAVAAGSGAIRVPSLQQVETSDFALVIGMDPTGEAPLLDLALFRARAESGAALHFVSLDAGRLGEFATSVDIVDPLAAADRIEAITAALRNPAAGGPLADAIAAAEVPLLVTGTQHRNPRLLEATLDLAATVGADRDAAPWFMMAVPEANTLGSVLLDAGRGMSILALIEAIESGEITAVVLAENDLLTRFDDVDRLTAALRRLDTFVVLDHLVTPTVDLASHALPAAAAAECGTTLVNNEGRMQRCYQVLRPPTGAPPAWKSACDLLPEGRAATKYAEWHNIDDVTAALASAVPVFAAAGSVAPPAGFRHRNQRIPRMSTRYSGRNATIERDGLEDRAARAVLGDDGELPVVSNRSDDLESPLSFSMEGFSGRVPPALMARVWSPGWNSNEAINQFQIEVGGPLHGGDPGVRIFGSEPGALMSLADRLPTSERPAPEPGNDEEVLVCAASEIFGSEETSRRASALAELAPSCYLRLHPQRAADLGLADGQSRRIGLAGGGLQVQLQVTVTFDTRLPIQVVVLPFGYPTTGWWQQPTWMRLDADEEAP